MENLILSNKIMIRLGFFVGLFVLLAVSEEWKPRRQRLHHRLRRWPHNIGIVGFNSLIVTLLVPLTTISFATYVSNRGWGLFGVVSWPLWLEILLSLVLLDLVVYGQHVVFHKVPLLWRVHRVHHADTDFDVTSGVRFHPIEILLSLGLKMLAILLLGVSPVAVILFEIILNGTAMFNHSNLNLSESLDRLLRRVVVTPDMHRVHHSVHPDETDRNYGFNLPWWDLLFGTYRAQPRDGHTDMLIGLNEFREPVHLSVRGMLTNPFLNISDDRRREVVGSSIKTD